MVQELDWDSISASAFVLKIREGRVDEYRRRHREVWPELIDLFEAQGVLLYEIFLDEAGRRAFGYRIDLKSASVAVQETSVEVRWRDYMADVLEMEGEEVHSVPIERVFHLRHQSLSNDRAKS